MLPHIYKEGGTLAISLPTGEMKMIDTAHKNYKEIVEGMKAGEDEKVIELINIAEQLERSIRAANNTENVTIKDGEVLFQGEPIHNTLTTRMINMVDDGFDIGHLVLFLENLMKNPSYRAVNELYTFLEVGSIPITENGTFLTYKKITEDWKDIHSETFDNSIGSTPTMPRNHVNEDSSQTCSAGLHVCSYDYLKHFGSSAGNRVVVCEINPEHVVSIPDDYNNTKMRVCSYKVVGEVEDYKEVDILGSESVIMTEDIPQPSEQKEELAAYGKALGKMVSNQLDSFEVNSEQIVEALIEIGYEENLSDKALLSNNKKIGKLISKLVRDGTINGYQFEDALMEVKANEEDEAYDEDEDEDQDRCPRCGGVTTYQQDECSFCGYYFEEGE